MKDSILIIILLFALLGQIYGQTDTGNLEVKNRYYVQLEYRHKVNGRKVSKRTHEKYVSINDMKNCCPCIRRYYDEFDKLLFEGVHCEDCRVGWFKEYYRNGNIKITGNYKENPTGDWNNIFDRGYCRKHGQWTYFNEIGDTLYSEFWENGEFVKQVPEQNKVEIWKIELMLDGQKIEIYSNPLIPIDQIKNLKINPKYKNSHIYSELTVFFEISEGYKRIKKQFTIESFQYIEVDVILLEAGISKEKVNDFNLSIYADNQVIRHFRLKIEK
jgi:hypothetical protein